MGEEPRAGGAQVSDASPREPHEIRRDIESTRSELGDTVGALAEKADVKAQAQRKVADVRRSIDGKRAQLMVKARERPVPVALVGAFAAAAIVGWAIKR